MSDMLNMSLRLFVTDDNEQLPITDMCDIDGDPTDDPELAVAAVAGPTKTGEWITIDLKEFNAPAIRN